MRLAFSKLVVYNGARHIDLLFIRESEVLATAAMKKKSSAAGSGEK